MANSYFQFKQFTVHQEHCAMKVTTDGCLFGAWTAVHCQDAAFPRVLDIGTGTGLLSLMFSQKINCEIDAIEIDLNAYEQAKANFGASPWKENIHAIHADARSFAFEKQYNIILSNPPFYENDLRSGSTSKNKAHHNESLLLEELLALIKANLAPAGRFFILLPFRRNKEIGKIFNQAGLGIRYKTLVHQSTQHDPFRIMLEGKHANSKKEEPTIDELAIKDNSNQYTKEFTTYLKDYYLYL